MSLKGSDIAIMREQLGWPRDDFAGLIGTTESAIRRWEAFGEEDVRVESVFRDVLLAMKHVFRTRSIEEVREHLAPGQRQGLLGLYLLLGLRYSVGAGASILLRESPVPVAESAADDAS